LNFRLVERIPEFGCRLQIYHVHRCAITTNYPYFDNDISLFINLPKLSLAGPITITVNQVWVVFTTLLLKHLYSNYTLF